MRINPAIDRASIGSRGGNKVPARRADEKGCCAAIDRGACED
jgi:hypothetical protein